MVGFRVMEYEIKDIGDGIPVRIQKCPMCGIAPTNVDDCGEFGNPDCPYFGIGREEYEKLYMKAQPPAVHWHSAEEVPPVEVGELSKFWVAVLSHKVFVFCASYANRPLLLNEDGELIKPVGWMNEFYHPSFDEYYETITFNDEYQLLGWAEYVLPIWDGPAL